MSDVAEGLATFVNLLRASGIETSPGESALALRALAHVDVRHRRQVYLALRTVLVRRVEQFMLFDEAFSLFFDGATVEPVARDRELETGEAGYSPTEAVLTDDLATLPAADVTAAVRWLVKQLRFRQARRWEPTKQGRRVAIRQTVRHALRHGGLPIVLIKSRRRFRPAHLVLLIDVSGSMAPYSRAMLTLATALMAQARSTRAFTFATDISTVLTTSGGGGTRIGDSLHAFVDRFGSLLRSHRTAVIILSDGLDLGEPARVASALTRLRQGARRLIWLNPLAGDPHFEPLTRAMVVARPFLDQLAPGHSLRALEEGLRLGTDR